MSSVRVGVGLQSRSGVYLEGTGLAEVGHADFLGVTAVVTDHFPHLHVRDNGFKG